MIMTRRRSVCKVSLSTKPESQGISVEILTIVLYWGW